MIGEMKESGKQHSTPNLTSPINTWILDTTIVTLASLFTRFYKLCEPDIVCWDETHFGKFASYYIRSENYFDVHPPLGKLMLGASGVITGYNGSFSFEEPGEENNNKPSS
eukprot:sb/3477323/